MPLDAKKINKIVVWAIFGALFIAMLLIMHPAWLGF